MRGAWGESVLGEMRERLADGRNQHGDEADNVVGFNIKSADDKRKCILIIRISLVFREITSTVRCIVYSVHRIL